MAAKLFGLDGSTVRRIVKLFALDGSTPRRVKKLFANDSGDVRLIFEDFSTFTISGTANEIVTPVNEVIDFGFRTDFSAGGTDVNVNTNGSGDASNVGVTGITIDVDSSHTYSSAHPAASNVGVSGITTSGVGFAVSSASNLSGSIATRGNNYLTLVNAIGGFRSSNFRWTAPTGVTYNGTAWGGSGSTGDFAHYYNATNRVQVRLGSGTGGGISWLNQGIVKYPSAVQLVGLTQTSTGRRARVQNGTNRTFTISSGGLSSGGNFSTGALSAGASTGFITANSTSEAWTLVGVAQKNPATFTISNADNSIQVSGTFGDGENATQARDRIQSVLNGNSTFQGKFNTGVDVDKTISGVAHKVVTFTSDAAENTSDFSITVTANDGSNTTPYEATTTQGATESLQTTVQVTRAVEGSSVSSTKSISSLANTDTAGAEVATLGGDISYDSGTNKLKVQDVDATVSVSNAGSLAFSKD